MILKKELYKIFLIREDISDKSTCVEVHVVVDMSKT